MKNKRFIFILTLIILIFAVVTFYNYEIGVHKITSNPIITEISNKDIKIFEKEFSISFPNGTKIDKAQYLYDFREPMVTFTVEIPIASVNDFTNEITSYYEKSANDLFRSDPYGNYEALYISKGREHTCVYSYIENNGYKRFYISYYRPSQNIYNFFKK